MMRPVVALCIGAIIWIAGPHAAAAASCLETAKTQSEITICSAKENAAAAAKLARAYEAVMCHLDATGKRQLAASQQAWEAFRNADCAFWAGGGSIAPSNENFCRADLAEKRAAELDRWPPNADRED